MLSSSVTMMACFNSLCAYASVNHLHWHLYYLLQPFRLPTETCSAKPLADECYEIEGYSAQGFVFQTHSAADVDRISTKIYLITKLLADLNIAHNLFIARGYDLDRCRQR